MACAALRARPELLRSFNKHTGLYAYRRDFLLTYAKLPPTPLEQSEMLEQMRALEHGYRIKVVAVAHRSIGAACVGVNGDPETAPLVIAEPERFTYFTAPAGHTFLWRLFEERREAVAFEKKRGDRKAVEWAEGLPLASAKELKSYH